MDNTSVGLEGVWSALANKAESFTSTISSVLERGYDHARFKQVRGAIEHLFNRGTVTGFAPSTDPAILKWFQGVDFMSVSPVTVFIPRGLEQPYAVYLPTLMALAQMAAKLPEELLNPANGLFGTLINNPSMLRSASKLPIVAPLLHVDPEKEAKTLGQCFGKNVSDQAPFGKMYKSLSDYQQVKTTAGELQALASSPSMLEVEKAALLIVDHVETLTRSMKEDETFTSVSNAVKQQLIDITNRCAQWVELYAVLQYQILILNAALTDTEKKIKSLAKR